MKVTLNKTESRIIKAVGRTSVAVPKKVARGALWAVCYGVATLAEVAKDASMKVKENRETK